jgi:hypothetical protein
MRVFSQGSWKTLLHWDTPPGSRADWVHGISMANLGDLEPYTRRRKRKGTTTNNVDNIGRTIQNKPGNATSDVPSPTMRGNAPTPSSGWQSQPIPTCAAGAWISELTFRGEYPALRLSRLSFLKSGADAWAPAHFESVAAILPLASLSQQSLRNFESMSLLVQGVWCAWDPSISRVSETSALNDNMGSTRGIGNSYGGKNDNSFPFSGTHSPPAELRLIASHKNNSAVIMEFPLWGDSDFGAMELGSPLRYELCLEENMFHDSYADHTANCPLPATPSVTAAAIEFKSNTICASLSADQKQVELTMYKKGTMNLVGKMHDIAMRPRSHSEESIATTVSIDSSLSHQSYDESGDRAERFVDWSLLPLPISLRPIVTDFLSENEQISIIKWWPDRNVGGVPRLLLVTTERNIFVVHIPEPWESSEPIVPMDNSFILNPTYSFQSEERDTNNNNSRSAIQYEIQISPHPEFGLGLRLESDTDGMSAIVGSFKRNPLTGGRLPAEHTGRVYHGDRLIAVNDMSLDGKAFDEIIETVRSAGLSAQGGSIKMKFQSMDLTARKKQESLIEGLEVIQRKEESIRSSSSTKIMDTITTLSSNIVSVSLALPSLPHTPCSFVLIPWNCNKVEPSHSQEGDTSLLISASGNTIIASCLHFFYDSDGQSKVSLTELGRYDLPGDQSPSIVSLFHIENFTHGFCVGACGIKGEIHLVFIDTVRKNQFNGKIQDFIVNFKSQVILDGGNNNMCLVRAANVDLIATMSTEAKGKCVDVWCATAFVRNHQYSPDANDSFSASKIVHNSTIEDNEDILDFRWITGGGFESFPWLVTFSKKSSIVHRRTADDSCWIPVVELSHPYIRGARPNDDIFKCHLYHSLSPADMYPHVVSALRSIVHTSHEQKSMLSDWHPESVLAYLCLEKGGVIDGLNKKVKGLLNWLSTWLDLTEPETTYWIPQSNLSCAPFDVLYSEDKISSKEAINRKNPVSLIDSLTNCSQEKGDADTNLQSKLQSSIKRVFLGESSTATSIMTNDSKSMNSTVLPEPLRSMNPDELCFLWAIGEFCQEDYQSTALDDLSQMTILAYDIMKKIESSGYEESSVSSTRGLESTETRSFLMKSTSSSIASERPTQPLSIPASTCLSALLSSTQSLLLRLCKPIGEMWTWELARKLSIPFWLRSDEDLKKISEEIAQSKFKTSTDSMECALFYVATGNMRMLKTVAAADRNQTGRTFFNFITKHDFSSARGKSAAEKNAFSLLRKRKYCTAAAFFLLSEPPMLQHALDIIVNKMHDFALAFFVSRLVESSRNASITNQDNLIIGKSFSLSNAGGGGGFASQGYTTNSLVNDSKDSSFREWKSDIKRQTRHLLESYLLPKDSSDEYRQCIYLLWLGRPNDAIMCLAGGTFTKYDAFAYKSFEFGLPSFKERKTYCPSIRAVDRVNSTISNLKNFLYKPKLIRVLDAPSHVKYYVSVNTSQALRRRGLEIASISALSFQNNDYNQPKECLKDETFSTINSFESRNATMTSSSVSATAAEHMSSSIFDSFDVPAHKLKNTVPAPATTDMSSSIFDAFDVPAPKPKNNLAAPATATVDMSSSIFDSFDVPAPKPKNTMPVPAMADMSSSIFDSFDVPAPTPKNAAPVPAMADMSSSIFDSFDVPAPKPKNTMPVPAMADMSSSIFDSFDVPAPTPKNAAPVPAMADMSSSIFDSFDVPAPEPKDAIMTSSYEPVSGSTSCAMSQNSTCKDIAKESEKPKLIVDSCFDDIQVPTLWDEWCNQFMLACASQRLLREMARIVTPFLGDAQPSSMPLFRRHVHPLISYSAAHVFQDYCEGQEIFSTIEECLHKLSETFSVTKSSVVHSALNRLGYPYEPLRIVFAVLLHCLTGRTDLAEYMMRSTAHDLIEQCDTFVASNDDLAMHRKTQHHISSQYLRRKVAEVSLQLELCLWLQRGKTFPMSKLAIKECTLGVRIGFTISSWGRCHEALEHLLKCEPDSSMDFERGRQLWSSMKMIINSEEEDNSTDYSETTSGGWEFLVDCSREESKTMLQSRKCGSFLLRPNPGDHGIFTLSFRTNLPSGDESSSPMTTGDESSDRVLKRDDSVQHAVIRLTDAGFKCGSFGPFSSLIKLLQAVSDSLPFDLLLNEPPSQSIIQEEGGQSSPNSVFIRRLALHSKTEHYRWNVSTKHRMKVSIEDKHQSRHDHVTDKMCNLLFSEADNGESEAEKIQNYGIFSQLLVLSELRKQFCATIASKDEIFDTGLKSEGRRDNPTTTISEASNESKAFALGFEDVNMVTSRMIRPFLNWCRFMEIYSLHKIFPISGDFAPMSEIPIPVSFATTETSVEAVPTYIGSNIDCGDAIIRRMIQPQSGVEFRTLRVGEAGQSAVVVLFRKSQAMKWIIKSGAEKDENDAAKRLEIMEKRRVIEQVDLSSISFEKMVSSDGKEFSPENELDVRYRFVDPWEVEVVDSKDGEPRGASLGRQRFVPFSIGTVARSCEDSQRYLGGLHLLSLWSVCRGGTCLTNAINSVHPPWERDAGGDLQVNNGIVTQSSIYMNCIGRHLYRNALFRRLQLPQRFIVLIQIEILDLKNLTAPGGSPSITAYALLRLKREASNAPLTQKARTLDSACTEAKKINKSSGPNAPASWGSVVRFRFPLPDGVNCDGLSSDVDREALFKGPPNVLQLSVYEKKFMTTQALGVADIQLDSLSTGSQLEEWAPLRSTNNDITWFARLRLTLRFELMNLAMSNSSDGNPDSDCPSSALRRMKMLSRTGRVHEDIAGIKHVVSTPDIGRYFESFVG